MLVEFLSVAFEEWCLLPRRGGGEGGGEGGKEGKGGEEDGG